MHKGLEIVLASSHTLEARLVDDIPERDKADLANPDYYSSSNELYQVKLSSDLLL